MKHNFSITDHAIILEEQSAPYTLGIFLTEQAALDRLDVCKRSLNPNCSEQVWLYTLRVENGVITNRKDLSFENPSQETHEC